MLLRKVGKHMRLTIPKDLREWFNFKRKHPVYFQLEGDLIYVRPKELVRPTVKTLGASCLGSDNRVLIPPKVKRLLDLDRGDFVLFSFNDYDIVIHKAYICPESLYVREEINENTVIYK